MTTPDAPSTHATSAPSTSAPSTAALKFHALTVSRVSAEAAGAVAITFAVPDALRDIFQFEPGQFLTLRAVAAGQDLRRSYSICSDRARYQRTGELEVGIRAVEGGVFSNWAASTVQAGDTLQVMPPQGRFTVRRPRAVHRAGFAAGSGITPILSIIATTLAEQPASKFTLVYGNQRMASVMFNEALQDLKDRYPERLTLVHILSRQAQDVDLLQGRIDTAKVNALLATLLPAASLDEVFICGPEAMIEATERALLAAGVPQRQVHTERFSSADSPARVAMPVAASAPDADAATSASASTGAATAGTTADSNAATLSLILDGKRHELHLPAGAHVLDTALSAGLDLPFSCKAGVCCTCRAKVLSGQVHMDKNYTLEQWEVDKGFVLTCQARALTPAVVLSFDER
jgi:ring-1,2-phenylacetyl-CoA epoxidase subunit PaaE